MVSCMFEEVVKVYFQNRSAEIDVETINVAGKNPKVAAVLPSPKAKKSASALLESLENFNMALLPSNVSKGWLSCFLYLGGTI